MKKEYNKPKRIKSATLHTTRMNACERRFLSWLEQRIADLEADKQERDKKEADEWYYL